MTGSSSPLIRTTRAYMGSSSKNPVSPFRLMSSRPARGVIFNVHAVLLVTMNVLPAIDAIRCYSCTGKTDDGVCGTPFHGADLRTCEGQACIVSRTIVEVKQAVENGVIDPSCASWAATANTRYDGCFTTSTTSLADCQLACFTDVNCVGGIDWASDKPEGDKCCIAGPSAIKNPYATLGVTHYDIIRNLDCQVPCHPGPLFLAVGNTAYMGSTVSASKTIIECQKDCLDAKGCQGIDWTQQSTSGSGQCKLVGESARKRGPSPGTTHYNMYRNYQCATRAYETFTRTCSASFRNDVGTCEKIPGVKNGIECVCDTRFCNGGKKDVLLTAEYQLARESSGIVDRKEETRSGDAAADGVDGEGGGAVDTEPTKKYRFYQLYNKASMAATAGRSLLTLSIVYSGHFLVSFPVILSS